MSATWLIVLYLMVGSFWLGAFAQNKKVWPLLYKEAEPWAASWKGFGGKKMGWLITFWLLMAYWPVVLFRMIVLTHRAQA